MRIIVDELDYYECPYFTGRATIREPYCDKTDNVCEVYEHRIDENYDDKECIGLIEYKKFIKKEGETK